jgi:hypothetical protein
VEAQNTYCTALLQTLARSEFRLQQSSAVCLCLQPSRLQRRRRPALQPSSAAAVPFSLPCSLLQRRGGGTCARAPARAVGPGTGPARSSCPPGTRAKARGAARPALLLHTYKPATKRKLGAQPFPRHVGIPAAATRQVSRSHFSLLLHY